MRSDKHEPKAIRLSRLIDEVAYALEDGVILENKLDALRLLWAATPNQEKDQLSYTLRDIEEFVANLKREKSMKSSKLKGFPLLHVPAEQMVNY